MDQEYLKHELGKLPGDAVCAFAARAALRTLPALSARRAPSDPAFCYLSGDKPSFAFAVPWAATVSAVAARYPNVETIAYAAAGAATADAFIKLLDHASANFAATAAADAADAASAFRASGMEAKSYVAVRAARAATASTAAYLAFATSSPYAKAAYEAVDAAHDALEWDLKSIRRNTSSQDTLDILTTPLWPKERPTAIENLLVDLNRDLRALEAGFEVWIDWYVDRMDGVPWDWELMRQCGLLPVPWTVS